MPQRLVTLSIEPLEYRTDTAPPPLAALVTSLTESLFLRSLKAFWETVRKFTEKNQELLGYPPRGSEGFTLAGEVFRVEGAAMTRNEKPPQLHSSLQAQFRKIMEAEVQAEDSKGRLRMFLTNLLRPCKTWQDVHDALPDFTHDLVKDFHKLTRVQQAGYTMMDNPRSQRSYENNVELLEYYSTVRLID